jgi:hypothetical protein
VLSERYFFFTILPPLVFLVLFRGLCANIDKGFCRFQDFVADKFNYGQISLFYWQIYRRIRFMDKEERYEREESAYKK